MSDGQEALHGMDALGRIPLQSIQEVDASRLEEENTRVVVLCVDGQVNDIQVRFLIDSGASECFMIETLVDDNNLLLSKVKNNQRHIWQMVL